MKKKEDEKYFICPECGDLTTESAMMKEISEMGSNGMCHCCFTETIWNYELKDFDVETTREFIQYQEINKFAFDKLVKCPQQQRIKLLHIIPKELSYPKKSRIAKLEKELKELKR